MNRAKEKMGEHGTKMELFIKTLISNLPYMVLCCIPLFAFVLKILYLRKRTSFISITLSTPFTFTPSPTSRSC